MVLEGHLIERSLIIINRHTQVEGLFMKKIFLFSSLVSLLFVINSYSAEAARIKSIEGKISIMRAGADKWRDAKVNTVLNQGDQLYTREESFAEVIYTTGAVLRMDENTKIVIDEITEKGHKTSTPIGNIWVNMRKLLSKKSEFELRSPTATAAIRGTVFQMNTDEDTTTDVSVYKGKVAVGPGSKNVEKGEEEKMPPKERYEVQGPTEVPGPYEVTLEHWRMIVSGQRISVKKDGKFSQEEFDFGKVQEDDFVKKNLELDKKLGE